MASYAKFTIKDRAKLKKYVKMKLGWPIVSIEITDEQLDFCIDEACEVYSKWVHYDQEYYALNLKNVSPITKENPNGNYLEGKGYRLPDRIVGINQIHEGRLSWFSNMGTDLDFFLYNAGFTPGCNMFGGANGGNMLQGGMFLDLYLYQNALKGITQLISGYRFTFNYNERSKFLMLDPDPQVTKTGTGVIILECFTVRDEDELLGEDYVKRLAVALTKQMVGQVRAKFGSGITFPGGGQVDSKILDEGKEEYNAILEELKQTEPPYMFFLQA